MTEPLLQPDDVCAYLGITKRTLYELVATRRIEHIKMGGLLRFRQSQLDAWLDAQIVPVNRLRTVPVTRKFRAG